MVGELITLPLRVGVRATQLSLRATAEAVAVVADATGRLIDHAVGRGSAVPQARPAEPGVSPAPERAGFEPDLEPERELEVSLSELEDEDLSGLEDEAEPLAEPEPAHVSEEPVIVEEIAEPGAEDGAGAAVHVQEPWRGYEQMNAQDVIARLAGATPATLAAIKLYESEGKSRVTVLDAVERELRISNGSGSQS